MQPSEVYRRRIAVAARTPGLDAQQMIALAAAAPDLEALARASRTSLAALGLTTRAIDWLTAPDAARVERDLDWLERHGASLVAANEAGYPSLLRESPNAPAVLQVRGNISHLSNPQIAIVGSRNPTAGGLATARVFAAFFARAGLVVTSGLALGIDAASHEGAIQGGGATLAVLGCGLDVTYPAENRALAERIVANGALVTEFPLGIEPRPHHFPQRNRIIAGLSHGVVVVEAASNSGSLITARLAGTAGREVFAVPSSIHNEVARGCHELIRQGAKLVERPEDVLSDLKISLSSQLVAASSDDSPKSPLLDKEYKILLDALAFEPASIDSLIERTGLNSSSIASMLLILELEGHVAPHPGGRYSRMAGQ